MKSSRLNPIEYNFENPAPEKSALSGLSRWMRDVVFISIGVVFMGSVALYFSNRTVAATSQALMRQSAALKQEIADRDQSVVNLQAKLKAAETTLANQISANSEARRQIDELTRKVEQQPKVAPVTRTTKQKIVKRANKSAPKPTAN